MCNLRSKPHPSPRVCRGRRRKEKGDGPPLICQIALEASWVPGAAPGIGDRGEQDSVSRPLWFNQTEVLSEESLEVKKCRKQVSSSLHHLPGTYWYMNVGLFFLLIGLPICSLAGSRALWDNDIQARDILMGKAWNYGSCPGDGIGDRAGCLGHQEVGTSLRTGRGVPSEGRGTLHLGPPSFANGSP